MNKIGFIIGVLVLCLSACTGQQAKKAAVQYVRTDTVRAYGDQGVALYPGKVKAAEDVSLAFRVSGTIQRFYADEGSFVRKGQLVAELDPRDYQVQLSATEAEYKQVKAEAERVMALYKQNSTTANNNDKAVYGLQQITAKYNNHKDQLAYTKLYAPFDGYVQKRLFDTHETVGAGMPVFSMICKGVPEVEIHIPASAYMERELMDGYSCTFDVFPDEVFPLSLVSVNQKANANQLYTMRLRLGSSPSGKMPAAGMPAMVRISTRLNTGAEVLIPVTSLFSEKDKSFVYVLRNRKLQKREVKPVRFRPDGSAVIAGGLQAGEIVVTAGVHVVKDGQEVEPLPGVSSSNVGGLL